jgi:hypothetical protein
LTTMDSHSAVQRLLREALPAKVCVAKSDGKLCRRFVQREKVEAQPRSLPNPTGANRLFRPREREKLGPHDGLGPSYRADEARDAISWRYKNPLALVRHAHPRLVRDSRLCDRVALTRGAQLLRLLDSRVALSPVPRLPRLTFSVSRLARVASLFRARSRRPARSCPGGCASSGWLRVG